MVRRAGLEIAGIVCVTFWKRCEIGERLRIMGFKFRLTTCGMVLFAQVLFFSATSLFAATITVTSTADGGGTCPGSDCTLREAILVATSGDDTINFSLPANSVISLTNGELFIESSLTIDGPGANFLTVQRSTAAGTPSFRVFDIEFESVTISGLTIANGSEPNNEGGAIRNKGFLTLNNVTISGNLAGIGGGIYNFDSDSQLTITNSTISGNTANTGGGIQNQGILTLTGSTISGNTASNGVGGGMRNNATAAITNCTISGNTATNMAGILTGGGIAGNAGATTTLKNSIVANNTAPIAPDLFEVTSQGYNFIGDNSSSGFSATTGDQVGTGAAPKDPKLGPLQDNGGPTKTQALLAGSSAIDAGNSAGASSDQRGFARPVDDPGLVNASGGDGSDIGAFEVQTDQLPGCQNISSVVTNTNDSGAGSLRGVIANVCPGSTITFAPNVTGAITLTSSELVLNKNLTINGPGANLLSVQRSTVAGTPNFRIFHINGTFRDAISGLTIAKGNLPGNLGGGISNDNGTLLLTNATVSGNTADIGAGIYTARAATIMNSTISNNIVSGNLAGDGGGGIYNQGGTLDLTNSTISGNTAHIANGGAQGGAIRNNLGTATLTSSTLVSNSADSGGAIYNSNSGTVNSFNTIVALNTSPSGPDVNGFISSSGFNIIGNTTGATIAGAKPSDQLGVTAVQLNLGPLLDNGGPTFTHALLSGSVAIDRGNSGGISHDQRGYSRPHDDPNLTNVNGGDGSDMGAFEVGGGLPMLKILAITRLANGHISLLGSGVATNLHTIQAAPDPSGASFVPIGSAMSNDSGNLQYDDAGAAGLTKRFYRLTFP